MFLSSNEPNRKNVHLEISIKASTKKENPSPFSEKKSNSKALTKSLGIKYLEILHNFFSLVRFNFNFK